MMCFVQHVKYPSNTDIPQGGAVWTSLAEQVGEDEVLKIMAFSVPAKGSDE